MGIEDPIPTTAAPEPLPAEGQAPPRPTAPAWADESTIAVSLTDLFGDDAKD
jgi:hypothetical protein